jgi:hypothetical protein
LSLEGSVEELEHRYRELVHFNNAQLNSLKGLTFSECIKEINKREAAKIVEQKKHARSERKIETLRSGQVTKLLNSGYKELEKVSQSTNKSLSEAWL